jgi:hypothetical protein
MDFQKLAYTVDEEKLSRIVSLILVHCQCQCCGSVKDGSGSADPYFWLTDPDPAIFLLITFEAIFTSFFKDKSHKEVTKQ